VEGVGAMKRKIVTWGIVKQVGSEWEWWDSAENVTQAKKMLSNTYGDERCFAVAKFTIEIVEVGKNKG
jgi:hypothetical protein